MTYAVLAVFLVATSAYALHTSIRDAEFWRLVAAVALFFAAVLCLYLIALVGGLV